MGNCFKNKRSPEPIKQDNSSMNVDDKTKNFNNLEG